MRKVHGGRAMLNLPGFHTTAAIVAEVENTEDWSEGRGRSGKELDRYTATPNITCTISDCSGTVALEFDIETDNEFTNAMTKITTMQALLAEFKAGLVTERGRFMHREKLIPDNKRHGLDENPMDMSA